MTKETEPKINTKGADVAYKFERLMKKLIQCMTQETLALQAHNRHLATSMAEEKARLLHNYRDLHAELLTHPDILKDVDTDIRKHLKTMAAEFEYVMKDNIQAIQSGRHAVGRLINRILQKAREAALASHKYYNAKGEMVEPGMKKSMTPTKFSETY